MNLQVNYQQLSQSSIFAGISPEQIQCILPCIAYSIKEYEGGERIFTKGDVLGNIGIVLAGQLNICTEDSHGQPVVLTEIPENHLIGEAYIFATGSSVPHDVFADGPSRVLYLASDFFMHPCGSDCPNKESHGEVMRNLLRILSDRTVVLNRKIKYLTAPDLQTKLAMYLYDMHVATGLLSFNMPLNRDGLAEYLSVARPSLSREFVGLRKLGVIDFYRSSVDIQDLPQLFALAHPSEN